MIKKITTVALISAAFLCSTVSVAATKCAKNQYLDGNKCVACKGNATCDGQHFKCKSGYMFEPALGTQACASLKDIYKIGGIPCAKNQYFDGNKCVACKGNATCDGREFKCKTGYMFEPALGTQACASLKDVYKIGGAPCAKNQYFDGNKCVACKGNATCNGREFKCKTGYVFEPANGTQSCSKAFCVDDKAYKTNGTDTGCTAARPVCVKGATFSSAWRNEASGVAGDHCVECVTDNYCTRKYGNKKPVCDKKTYTCASCVDNKAYKTGGTDTGCTAARPVCVKGAKFSSAWRNEASGVAGDNCVECVTDNYCTKKYGNKKPVCNQKTYTCVAK